ncbi:uncharacterized protein [Onthophagus taurus]|uniref:uncharacterized protein n=1 Tax=Onthophagus taurus TaxID=166361 RepID=UPI0039BE346F
MSRRVPPGRPVGTSQSRSSVGGCGPSCPAVSSSARLSRIQPPRVSSQPPRPSGTIPRMTAPRSTARVPSAAPPQPVYQKRNLTTSSGYGLKPTSTSKITKTTTKSVEVKNTLKGPQKVIKEVTKAHQASSGANVGTVPLPSTSRTQTSVMQTRPVLERKSSAKRPPQIVPKSMLGNVTQKSRLSQQVDQSLNQVAKSNPRRIVTATGAKRSIVRAPTVMINDVPVNPKRQVITENIVESSPGIEKISRSLIGIEKLSPCTARKTELQLQQLQHSPGPHPPSPSKDTISVRNVISVTDNGTTDTAKIVTYEKTEPSQQFGLSPAEVSRMIREENQDISNSRNWKPIEVVSSVQTTLPIKKQEHEYMLDPLTHKALHDSVVIPEQAPDEAPLDEISPELLAAMIHTEEQGMDMVSEPTHIYTLLFPDDNELGPDVMEVNSAAPAPLDDVAVPSHTLPEAFYNNSVNPELERAILETEGQGKRPSAAGFSEYQEKKQPGCDQSEVLIERIKTKHVKKREPQIEAVKPLEEEEPPWGDDPVENEARMQEQREREMQLQQEQLIQIEKNLAAVVGAPKAPPPTVCNPADSFMVGLSNENAIDYILHVEPPTYLSKAQLRGSSVPPWFPGYYVAFPEIPELITTVKYPTIALTSAWRHVQPNIFPEDSFLVL